MNLLLFLQVAAAQLDPNYLQATVRAEDGTLLATLTFEPTELEDLGPYWSVGVEQWGWQEEAWPEEVLVIAAEEVEESEPTERYHQALFPEEPTLQTIPEGGVCYALLTEEAHLGWLVVEDTTLSWLIHEDAEVDGLIDLTQSDLVLKPVESIEDEGVWRAVVQKPL